ncbi:AAA family ATPase [Candidatus Chlorohelix allophototropha]|uniref:AAA family ATPase n=1 Tax=Candidatus Chlorohelix allophototropha TaxID=3003348 RepID=A0ABY9B6G2_9CHLR|nr:AAA family ATPase [Chloroflexota bacterium L227-S17]
MTIPLQSTFIIGRETELALAKTLLTRTRLLTLKGPAGVGKTRLAVQLAGDYLAEFSNNVYFVSLTPVSQPELVLSAIAQALGIAEENENGEKSLSSQLRKKLEDKAYLLILDNFEQVLEAVKDVKALIQACPLLKVIITSRELLRIKEETHLDLQPLPYPEPDKLPPLDQLARFPSIRLFLERVRASSPQVDLTPQNALTIAQICKKLDGLPLALELAAVRVRAFGLEYLEQNLNRSLYILGYGNRDLPEHQQNMRRTIEWSYHLLNAQQRKLFRRLGVFVDGFTAAAAEEVGKAANETLNILDELQALADCSMLQLKETPSGIRFRMFETIREFAIEILNEAGEENVFRLKHATYYLNLATKAKEGLSGARQGEWLETLAGEQGNLRAALNWSQHNNAALFINLCAVLWRFWHFRSLLEEGNLWFRQAVNLLEQPSENSSQQFEVGAMVLNGAGAMALTRRDYAAARTYFLKSQQFWLRAKETLNLQTAEERAQLQKCDKGISNVLGNLGVTEAFSGNHLSSKEYFEQSLKLSETIGDISSIAMDCNNLGLASLQLQQLEAAQKYFERSGQLFEQLGDISNVAICRLNLGRLDGKLKKYEGALEYIRQSFATSLLLKDNNSMADCVGEFAVIAVDMGYAEIASQLFGLEQAIRQEFNIPLQGTAESRYNDYYQRLKELLGEESFAKRLEQGRNLRLDELEDFVKRELMEKKRKPTKYPNGLTELEVNILCLLAQGLKTVDIAERLNFSNKYISNKLTEIYSKIGVESDNTNRNRRAEAVKYANDHRLAAALAKSPA